MRILLDTNAYSELKRGHGGVSDLVRRSRAVLVSAVVAGELLYGFRRGSRYAQNRRELEEFLDSRFVSLVPVTLATAEHFGRIVANLRSKGTPIPTNDAWIAAHTMETGAELVSFDAHYERIENLAWMRPD